MRGGVVFLHVLGVVLWIGGSISSMLIAVQSKHENVDARAAAARLLARLHATLVSPGAVLTLLSGFDLMMRLGSGAMNSGALLGMAATGILAGIMVLFVGLPTAMQRARAAVPDANGQLPPIVKRLSARQAVVSTIAGLLAVAALGFVYL